MRYKYKIFLNFSIYYYYFVNKVVRSEAEPLRWTCPNRRAPPPPHHPLPNALPKIAVGPLLLFLRAKGPAALVRHPLLLRRFLISSSVRRSVLHFGGCCVRSKFALDFIFILLYFSFIDAQGGDLWTIWTAKKSGGGKWRKVQIYFMQC